MMKAAQWIPAVMASLFLVGCNGASPVAPTETFSTAGSTENGTVGAQDDDFEGTPVHEWFRTEPAASSEGLIDVTGSSVNVLFNMCQATDTDNAARLKFTYDFENDGTIDYFGHCRQSHVYESNEIGRVCTRATVCIANRRDEPSCKQYEICLSGVPEVAPVVVATPTPTPVPTRPPCPTFAAGYMVAC